MGLFDTFTGMGSLISGLSPGGAGAGAPSAPAAPATARPGLARTGDLRLGDDAGDLAQPLGPTQPASPSAPLQLAQQFLAQQKPRTLRRTNLTSPRSFSRR